MEAWDSFYRWLGTSQSGNLAEWAGGVGTVLTLLAGLIALLRERRRAALAQSNRLSIWIDVIEGSPEDELVHEVKIINDADRPCYSMKVLVCNKRETMPPMAKDSFRELQPVAKIFRPGGQWDGKFETGTWKMGDLEWWLDYIDASNVHRTKNMLTDRVSSGKRGIRVLGRMTRMQLQENEEWKLIENYIADIENEYGPLDGPIDTEKGN